MNACTEMCHVLENLKSFEQCKYHENAMDCSKRICKLLVATRLHFADLPIAGVRPLPRGRTRFGGRRSALYWSAAGRWTHLDHPASLSQLLQSRWWNFQVRGRHSNNPWHFFGHINCSLKRQNMLRDAFSPPPFPSGPLPFSVTYYLNGP